MNAPFKNMTDEPFVAKKFKVKITRDVKYGFGGVGYGTSEPRYRDMLLDIYEPAGDSRMNRPALILAFGGAWHRGSKADDTFTEGQNVNTPIADYCEAFAKRGYVCFSIDYRLMQEKPDPGVTPVLPPGAVINSDRVNHVRGLLGLPLCTTEMMVQEIEASTDDMTAAVSYVRSHAHAMRIDVNRVAIGGFSAGAITALNAALAEQAPVAAVVALSGRLAMAAAKAYVTGRHNEPAILTFIGEHDLPSLLDNIDEYAGHLKNMSSAHQLVFVPGSDTLLSAVGSCINPKRR